MSRRSSTSSTQTEFRVQTSTTVTGMTPPSILIAARVPIRSHSSLARPGVPIVSAHSPSGRAMQRRRVLEAMAAAPLPVLLPQRLRAQDTTARVAFRRVRPSDAAWLSAAPGAS